VLKDRLKFWGLIVLAAAGLLFLLLTTNLAKATYDAFLGTLGVEPGLEPNISVYVRAKQTTKSVEDALEQNQTEGQVSLTVRSARSAYKTASDYADEHDHLDCLVVLRWVDEDVDDLGRLIVTQSGHLTKSTRRSLIKTLSGYRTNLVESCALSD
jgi:hypothetical protein